MDQGVKKTWIEALRSGKYLQGRGLLRQSNGRDKFCCLGVLVDLTRPEAWTRSLNNQTWLADGISGRMTTRLRTDIGLEGHFASTLIDMNDGVVHCGVENKPTHDFNQIADYIEENV